jgi:hypothetical protein
MNVSKIFKLAFAAFGGAVSGAALLFLGYAWAKLLAIASVVFGVAVVAVGLLLLISGNLKKDY